MNTATCRIQRSTFVFTEQAKHPPMAFLSRGSRCKTTTAAQWRRLTLHGE